MRGPTLFVIALAIGCGKDEGSSESTADAVANEAACGDIDGEGGDTGDVPNILGAWTATFGSYLYDGGACTVDGLEAADMKAWMDGIMVIDGRVPDMLYANFNSVESDRFFGLENGNGGVVFTGTKEFAGHVLYVSVGGLLYTQPQVERDEIRGFGYIGVDLNGEDTVIDCWLQGDFRAIRSGV